MIREVVVGASQLGPSARNESRAEVVERLLTLLRRGQIRGATPSSSRNSQPRARECLDMSRRGKTAGMVCAHHHLFERSTSTRVGADEIRAKAAEQKVRLHRAL